MENSTQTQQEFLQQYTDEAIAEDMIINLLCNANDLAKESLRYLHTKETSNNK